MTFTENQPCVKQQTGHVPSPRPCGVRPRVLMLQRRPARGRTAGKLLEHHRWTSELTVRERVLPDPPLTEDRRAEGTLRFRLSNKS